MNNKKNTIKIFIVAGLDRSLINFRGPLIKALCDSNIEVHAVAPNLTENTVVLEKLNEWGVICHSVRLQRAGFNPLRDVRALGSLFWMMRRIKPDIVLAYTIKPVVYGVLASWLANVPKRFALITGLGYAFTGKAEGKRKFIKGMARNLYAVALRKSSRVFFQNPDDERLFRELKIIPEKVSSFIVNGSGIDLVEFKEEVICRGDISFLLIARLLGDKGVREYVEAARKVKKKYPEAMFRLVGAVDDNPDSIKEIELEAWKEEGVVEYLGRLEDVRPAISNCSVYVLPSYREGTPRSVLEAMSMGRAVITTDAPGCRETVVDNKNGFLVPVKDSDALANAMINFIDKPELIERMGAASRKIAEEKYDVNKVNQQMFEGMGIND